MSRPAASIKVFLLPLSKLTSAQMNPSEGETKRSGKYGHQMQLREKPKKNYVETDSSLSDEISTDNSFVGNNVSGATKATTSSKHLFEFFFRFESEIT